MTFIKKKLWIIIIVAVVLLFIWIHSAIPTAYSAEESGWFTDFLFNGFLGKIFGVEFTDHIVRKIAHITEFTALGLALSALFDGSVLKTASAGILAALIDETVQIFSGRGALVSDVWVDAIGIAIGSAIGLLIFHIRKKRLKKRQKMREAEEKEKEERQDD